MHIFNFLNECIVVAGGSAKSRFFALTFHGELPPAKGKIIGWPNLRLDECIVVAGESAKPRFLTLTFHLAFD